MPLRVKERINVGATIAVPRSVMECFVRNPNSGAWFERRDGRSVSRAFLHIIHMHRKGDEVG